MTTALGLNRRNARIARMNPRPAIIAAKDKLETKRRLAEHDIAVPATLTTVRTRREARRFGSIVATTMPDRFVIKPARGSQGRGVLVVTDRTGPRWRSGSDQLDERDLVRHARSTVDGAYSETDEDTALVEPLLVADPTLAHLAPSGLPDVRVIVAEGVPLMAMLRVPTSVSGGRGNLHQGGLAGAIDLATGRIERAVHAGRDVDVHPDTGTRLIGLRIPDWPRLLDLATRCGAASGLGYLGVDLVVDASMGAIVLEVNSHPGLEIQNVCRRALVVA